MISIRDDKAEVENARLDACTREAYRHDEFKVSLCYSLDVMFEKLVVNVRSRLILSIRELRVLRENFEWLQIERNVKYH